MADYKGGCRLANLMGYMDIMDLWSWAIVAYVLLATVTLIPAMITLVAGVELNPAGASFEQSEAFSEEGKRRLTDHHSRLQGTLKFWKKRATLFVRFHYYCVVWTILSAWAVPLIAAVAPQVEGSVSRWLLVVIASHVALALSFHRGMKILENMKAFRHGESEYYDLYRRLLDRPQLFGDNEDDQLDTYFSKVERIRKYVRNAETEGIPDVEGLSRQANIDGR